MLELGSMTYLLSIDGIPIEIGCGRFGGTKHEAWEIDQYVNSEDRPFGRKVGLVLLVPPPIENFALTIRTRARCSGIYSLPAPQEALPAVYQVGGQKHIAGPVGGDAVFQPRPSPNIPLRPAGPGQSMVFALTKK